MYSFQESRLTATHMNISTITPLISLAPKKEPISFMRYLGLKLKFLKTASLFVTYANATAAIHDTIVAAKLALSVPQPGLSDSFTIAKTIYSTSVVSTPTMI